MAHWYTCVISVACNWLLGEDKEAERLYAKVENIPTSLSSLSDPLPKAVLSAYLARKTYLSYNAATPKTIYHLLDAASGQIEESLAYSSCKKQNKLVLVSCFFLKVAIRGRLFTIVHCSCIACVI